MILWTIVPGVLSVLLVAMLREPEGLAVGNGKIDWQWQSLPAPLKRYLVALGVFTLSQSPGGNTRMSSPLHRLHGGVVGATQGP